MGTIPPAACLQQGGAKDAIVLADWQTVTALLVQLLLAHASTLATEDARTAVSQALVALEQRVHGYGNERDRTSSSTGPSSSPSLNEDDLVSVLHTALRTSCHTRFGALLDPVLVPLVQTMLAGTAGIQAPAAQGGQTTRLRDLSLRGRAWSLLGAARLHLCVPPAGTDPAAR